MILGLKTTKLTLSLWCASCVSQMVEHFVLFSLKDDLTDAQKTELKEAIYSLRTLPGCSRLTFGEDHILTRGKGYTHALMSRHTSREAAKSYQVHPEHVRVRDEIIVPLIKREGGKPVILSVDFDAEVAEPLRWRELVLGAVAGAGLAAAFLRRRR